MLKISMISVQMLVDATKKATPPLGVVEKETGKMYFRESPIQDGCLLALALSWQQLFMIAGQEQEGSSLLRRALPKLENDASDRSHRTSDIGKQKYCGRLLLSCSAHPVKVGAPASG